jgi:hypothetical protein
MNPSQFPHLTEKKQSENNFGTDQDLHNQQKSTGHHN